MDLSQRFSAADDNLKLDPDEHKQAVEAHNHLGDVLVAAGVAKRTRLQGSFARKTMLPPLHDVDKVIELVDDLRAELEGSSVGPRRAMDIICSTVRPEFPGAGFEVKKHSLGITLPDGQCDFDAVPAFNDEDGSGWIKIADTTALSWKPSNTYALIDAVSARNQACDGRFVRQVRMVKQVVSVAGISEALPGLHVESFCYEAITETLAHPDAVAVALTKATELLDASYVDPTGADRISDRLQPHQVALAKSVLVVKAARAVQALRLAGDGDEQGAALIWAELLGEVFPSPADEEREALRRLHAAPILVPAAAAVAATPTRAWGRSV